MVLIFVPVVVYMNSLGNPFHYDDSRSIVDNLHIRDVGNIPAFFHDPSLFSEDPESAMFRPLLLTSFALNYAVAEFRVWTYHTVQIVFHVLCVLLLFSIAKELAGSTLAAGAGALAFAVHPIATEPVNYISSRSELFVTFFLLAGFLCFLQYRSGSRSLLWVLAAFAAALLSKSVAIVFPAVLLSYDLIFHRQLLRRQVTLYLSLGAMAVAYLVAVSRLLTKAVVTDSVRPFAEQIWSQMKAAVFYLKLLSIPHGLSVDHQFLISDSIGEPLVALACLALLSLLFVAISGSARPGLPLFLLSWWCLSLAPSSIIPLNVLVNEHRLYLPAGILALAVGTLASPRNAVGGSPTQRQTLIWALIACVYFALAVTTVRRNSVWRSVPSLWADAAAKAPLMARAHIYLGEQAERDKDRSAAITAFRTVLERDPYYEPAYLKLKDYIVEGSGDLAEAASLLEAGLQVNSSSADLWGGLAEVYRGMAQETRGEASMSRSWFIKSRDAYLRALSLEPGNAAFLNNLGNTYQALGEPSVALTFHLEAREVNEDDAATLLNLGNAYIMMGQFDDALGSYSKAVELDPQFAEAWMSLASVRQRLGDFHGASEARVRVVEITGSDRVRDIR